MGWGGNWVMVDSGVVRAREVSKAFGVPMGTVKRYLAVFRASGAGGIYRDRARKRSATKLTPEKREEAEQLLNAGRKWLGKAGFWRRRCTRRSRPSGCQKKGCAVRATASLPRHRWRAGPADLGGWQAGHHAGPGSDPCAGEAVEGRPSLPRRGQPRGRGLGRRPGATDPVREMSGRWSRGFDKASPNARCREPSGTPCSESPPTCTAIVTECAMTNTWPRAGPLPAVPSRERVKTWSRTAWNAMAEAVLKLRAVYLSGDFDAYWAFHIHQDQLRVHPPIWSVVPK